MMLREYDAKVYDSDSKPTKYVLFFFLGIFTFFLSGYLLRGVHAPMSIFLMGLIYLVLFALGLFLSGERSAGFALKAFAASFAALLLLSVGFFLSERPEPFQCKMNRG